MLGEVLGLGSAEASRQARKELYWAIGIVTAVSIWACYTNPAKITNANPQKTLAIVSANKLEKEVMKCVDVKSGISHEYGISQTLADTTRQ